MNPYLNTGYINQGANGDYLRESDIRAFDVMGYDIDTSAVPSAPGHGVQTAPGAGSLIRRSAVQLEWTPSANAALETLFLDDVVGGSVGRVRVLTVENAAPPYTIPLATLQSGHDYEWTVASENWRGYMSVASSFRISCAADLDDGGGNGVPDGGVDINDLTFLLTGYEAGDPAVDIDDGSGLGVPDGAVDINDLLFFLAHYEDGC